MQDNAADEEVSRPKGVPHSEGTGHSTAKSVHVTLHILNALELRGHEDECQRVVAPRYNVSVKHGPGRLEALGGGLLARELLGVTRNDQLATNEHGKPFLAEGGPIFNLSNDNGLVVLGIVDEKRNTSRGFDDAHTSSNAGPTIHTKAIDEGTGKVEPNDARLAMSDGPDSIGVDVNEVPNKLDRIKLSIASKYFLPAEAAAVGDGTSFAQRVAFARAFGNLEAALKAMGTGFDFDVRHHREALEEWQLASQEIRILPPSSSDARCAGGSTITIADDGANKTMSSDVASPAVPVARSFVIVVAARKQPQLSLVVHNARTDLMRLLQ